MSAQYEIQNVLKQTESLDVSPEFRPYSGVEIRTGRQDSNGNDIIYTAGDDSGRVLTIENEWGTQAQADNILSSIRGFVYQPLTTTGAIVNPAAEIGDGISVNDEYSGIYKMTRNYSSLMTADVEAPQSEELDHEYPYESQQERAFERRVSTLESEFRVTSSDISAVVKKTSPEGQTSFSWSLQDNGWEVKSNGNTVFKVSSSGIEVSGKITATSGAIGNFTIKNGSISTNNKTYGDNRQGVYIGDDGISLGPANSSNFRASKNGSVVAHNMRLTGTLTIGGKTITAAELRSGAQNAYDWNSNGTAGRWSTGSGYGYNYNSAVNGTSFNTGLKSNYLTVTGIDCGLYFYFNGYQVGRTTVKDYNGVSRNVLGWTER